MRWPWYLLALVLAIGALVVGAIWRWNKRTASTVEHLQGLQRSTGITHYDEAELVGLPPPVQRYFKRSLRPGQALITTAVVQHEGTFLTGGAGANWVPFRSTEHFTVSPPGFVWDARMRMMPVVPVLVRDSYIAGNGGMHGSIAGLVTLVQAAPTQELHEGAFQRYLAEAMWLPTALLPSQGVVWSPLDEHSARATLHDGHRSVSVDFHFNEVGDLVESRTMRYAEQDGSYILLPWGGRCSDHRDVAGMRIPFEAEVVWHQPDGPRPYWRGRITGISFKYADAS